MNLKKVLDKGLDGDIIEVQPGVYTGNGIQRY